MQSSRPKRQKVAAACDACRRLKVKCNGNQPVCDRCQKRAGGATECTWQASSLRLNGQIPTHQIKWLDERIQMLEHDISTRRTNGDRNLNNGLEKLIPRTTAVSTASGSCSPSPGEQEPLLLCQYSRASPNDLSKKRSYYQLEDSTTNNLTEVTSHHWEASHEAADMSASEDRSFHAIIGTTLDEEHTDGFFGSSSAGTFMQIVKKMVEQKLGGGPESMLPTTHRCHDNLPLLVPNHNTKQRRLNYDLPPRRIADSLMTSYWKHVHVLYPFLDKTKTLQDYDNLWRSNVSVFDEQSFLCLLNIIFALGSQLEDSTQPDERKRSSAIFCQRAQDLLDMVATGSVRSVQSFLLLGLYYQSTHEPHPCWVFVGLGIRTAQSLGLDSPQTSKRISDISTREILRKVWYGCVLMDRVLCMIYGRSCMISPMKAAAVPLPLATDEEYLVSGLSRQRTAQVQRPAVIDFYIFSLKLYAILHDILLNFYAKERQKGQAMDVLYDTYFGHSSLTQGHPSVFELERRLSTWQNSLPSHLQFGDHAQRDVQGAVFYRQAVILHQRQLHVRIVLLRPILSSFITSDLQDGQQKMFNESSLSHRMSLQCAIVCVQSAQEAIETIHEKRAESISDVGNLSAWWYNVLYLYTSATVLIAARLSSSILAEVSEESILDSWHKARTLLEAYSVFGTSTRGLVTTLRLLFEAVPRKYSRRRPDPRPLSADPVILTDTQIYDIVPLPEWHSLDANGFPSSSSHGPAVGPAQEATKPSGNKSYSSTVDMPDFDAVFDPNDFSWLMKTPFDI